MAVLMAHTVNRKPCDSHVLEPGVSGPSQHPPRDACGRAQGQVRHMADPGLIPLGEAHQPRMGLPPLEHPALPSETPGSTPTLLGRSPTAIPMLPEASHSDPLRTVSRGGSLCAEPRLRAAYLSPTPSAPEQGSRTNAPPSPARGATMLRGPSKGPSLDGHRHPHEGVESPVGRSLAARPSDTPRRLTRGPTSARGPSSARGAARGLRPAGEPPSLKGPHRVAYVVATRLKAVRERVGEQLARGGRAHPRRRDGCAGRAARDGESSIGPGIHPHHRAAAATATASMCGRGRRFRFLLVAGPYATDRPVSVAKLSPSNNLNLSPPSSAGRTTYVPWTLRPEILNC